MITDLKENLSNHKKLLLSLLMYIYKHNAIDMNLPTHVLAYFNKEVNPCFFLQQLISFSKENTGILNVVNIKFVMQR